MGSDGTIAAAGLPAGDPGRGSFMIDAQRPGKAAGR